MIIDCESCTARGDACADCVVTVVLGAPVAGMDVDPVEEAALAALADVGLVPRLRHRSAGGGAERAAG